MRPCTPAASRWASCQALARTTSAEAPVAGRVAREADDAGTEAGAEEEGEGEEGHRRPARGGEGLGGARLEGRVAEDEARPGADDRQEGERPARDGDHGEVGQPYQRAAEP